LDDGPLTGIERAGTRVEKGARGSTHRGTTSLSFRSQGERYPALRSRKTVYRFCFCRMTFRGVAVTEVPRAGCSELPGSRQESRVRGLEVRPERMDGA
jgi:hypothetical protein